MRAGPARRSRPGRAGSCGTVRTSSRPRGGGAPALPARGVVMDRDTIADRNRADARADRADDPGRFVAQHRREPRSHVPIGETSEMRTPRSEHLAHDLARARLRLGQLLDPDVVGPERAGDPQRRPPARPSSDGIVSATGARAIPRSVTSAVTSAAGVTSNAGLRQAVAGGASSAVPPAVAAVRTSSAARSSIVIPAPDEHAGSIVETGPATTTDPGRVRREREAVGPDLVRDVPIHGNAVTSKDHRVGRAGGDQPERPPSRRSARARSRAGAARRR